MIDPRDVDPDRSFQYKLAEDSASVKVVNKSTGKKEQLVDQLNENFKQVRLLRAALSDRDEVIATLHGSIAQRDKVIEQQAKSIKLRNRVRTLVYAVLGGASAKLIELLFVWTVTLFFGGHK